jgi:uncharacterized membrane protein
MISKWLNVAAVTCLVYAAITLSFLIAYSKYELDHHIVNGSMLDTNTNAGYPVILMNIFQIISLLILARAILQRNYKPVETDSNNDAYRYRNKMPTELEEILWALVGVSQAATIFFAFMSFGFNCHYPLPCYTIISPLYFLVLLYTHLLALAVCCIILGAIIWFLTTGVWQWCECADLFKTIKQQQQKPPETKQYETVEVVVQKLINASITYDNIDNIRKRTEEKSCGICNQEYQRKDIIELMKNCSHYFHKSCIDTWFVKNPNCLCPVCKTVNK